MNADFFAAIEDIEREKGIPKTYMMEKITQALLAAYKKDNPACADNVVISMDDEKKRIDMYLRMEVVDVVENPATQMLLDAAGSYSKRAKVGSFVEVPIETKKFGRIAAQAAKQVIIQGIREAERGIIFDEFTSKEQEILTGTVSRIERRCASRAMRASSATISPCAGPS